MRGWPPSSTRPTASSPARTCSKARAPSSRSDRPTSRATDPDPGSPMDNVSRFGVFLPTYIWADDGPERARNIVRFAQRVEELGFGSLFVTDHLPAAQHFYSASFLEPISTLAVAAGATERVRLGTSVLVLPTRHPVVLA